MENPFSKLKGKTVGVILYEPVEVEGIAVVSISGICGGGPFPGPVIINKVRAAKNRQDKDVLEETNLRGKTVFIHSNNIKVLISGK